VTSGRVALAALLAIVAFAGCGGGNGDGGENITLEQFAQEADAICLDAQLEIEGIPPPVTLSDVGPYAKRYAPALRGQIDRLRGLKRPEDSRETIEAFVDELDATATVWEDIGKAADRGDQQRVQALFAESQQRTGRIRELGSELGLQVCSPPIE
jgi:hypothetical protein